MLGLYSDKLCRKCIILGSGSPRRKELLEKIGLNFSVLVSNVDENLDYTTCNSVADYVEQLSKIKADATLKLLTTQNADILITADTVIAFNGEIMGKPLDSDDACDRINGKVHQVYSGVTICFLNKNGDKYFDTFSEKTDVQMATLSLDVIKSYVATDKAGAYGIQGQGGSLVKKINGDYYNVMGLPIHSLCEHLISGLSKM